MRPGKCGSVFGNAYHGRRVLLTGHTGFKGSWLALWLRKLGAEVTGLALPPEGEPNHWDLLKLGMPDHRQDMRDADAVRRVVAGAKPEIVFHLAAQSLVRRSYGKPLDTWSSNVMGTANLLDACRDVTGLGCIVVVTSDKCYENKESAQGYRESDRLGGHDPYSASKAATELVASSYRDAFFAQGPLLATARAGNVIGGGDWSQDRLIPDIARAHEAGQPLEVRFPKAVRPWQHVLESLHGYLLLGEQLWNGKREFARPWNFGPAPQDMVTVESILQYFAQAWPGFAWHSSAAQQPHETGMLTLDSTQAQDGLGWHSVWQLEEALQATAGWYDAYYRNRQVESERQLARFMEDAQKRQRAA